MIRTTWRAIAAAIFALAITAVPVAAREADTPDPAASPSEATAADLAARMPIVLAGIPMSGADFSAGQILAGLPSDTLAIELAAIAEASDASLDQLSIAFRGGTDADAFITVGAASIPGVPAAELQSAFLEVLVGPTDPELTSRERISERDVTVVLGAAGAGPEDTLYVVSEGETVWVVMADDETLEDALAQLPVDA